MPRLIAAGRWALAEFGPLIVFWALAPTLGVKTAIAGSILFILGDAAWRWRSGRPFTRLYLLVSALTLAFGGIDLVSVSPFMLKYEGAITNVATGVAFVAGATGEKPIIQEVAEARGESIPANRETRAFFRLFTLVWAAYFFVKAAFYVWAAWTMPMLEAMALRSAARLGEPRPDDPRQRDAGTSAVFLSRRLGLLPKPEEAASLDARSTP